MKELPMYKIITVNKWDDLHTTTFQSELNNKKNPILLDIKKLNLSDQEQILFLESKILSSVPSPHIPYPIYFVGTLWEGIRIKSFHTKEMVPFFFPQRGRGTSKLHQQLLIYNQLLQYHFDYLNIDEAQLILREYEEWQREMVSEYRGIEATQQLLQMLKQPKNKASLL